MMPVPMHRGEELTADQVEDNRQTVHGDAALLTTTSGIPSPTPITRAGTSTRPVPHPLRRGLRLLPRGPGPGRGSPLNFVESAAKATLVGEVFDDAATGQGLLNFFLRAINCGAIDETEATTRTGLTLDEIRTRSFLAILEGRTTPT